MLLLRLLLRLLLLRLLRLYLLWLLLWLLLRLLLLSRWLLLRSLLRSRRQARHAQGGKYGRRAEPEAPRHMHALFLRTDGPKRLRVVRTNNRAPPPLAANLLFLLLSDPVNSVAVYTRDIVRTLCKFGSGSAITNA
ncbi:MAG: hypothetical protein ACXW3X_09770 [Rhodoplanes sp.]